MREIKSARRASDAHPVFVRWICSGGIAARYASCMARRGAYDPLAPRNATAWLVVCNALSELVEARELAPKTDLRQVLTHERIARIAAEWDAEPMGARCSFFFCKRDGIRLFVGIQVSQPGGPRDPIAGL